MVKNFWRKHCIQNGCNHGNHTGNDYKLQSLKQETCKQAGNDKDKGNKGNPFEISSIHDVFSFFYVTGISGLVTMVIGLKAQLIPILAYLPTFPPISKSIDNKKQKRYHRIMSTIKVYRNGSVSVGNHSASIHDIWGSYDAVKPAERSGRLASVYASPSLAGMVRWTHANHMFSGTKPDIDLTSYEIFLKDAENIYVYDVEVYDRTLGKVVELESQSGELAQQYWDSGIPLTEWVKVSAERNLDPANWEVLVPIEAIASHIKISDRKILDAAPESSKEEIRQYLRNRKEFLKWCNWEPPAPCIPAG